MSEINEAFTKEFAKNQYSIPIVKCCASCAKHDQCGDEDLRICKPTGRKHRYDYLCGSSWVMSENLSNAGKGGGKVKKSAYLKFVIEHGKSMAEDWEREHGSRYLEKR